MTQPYEPDDLAADELDSGVRSSPLGSFMPEATYRPVPIVWFAAAWIVHSFALVFLSVLLAGRPPIFIWSTTFLVSILVVHWTFARGMNEAGTGWKAATVIVLALNWAFTALFAWGG